MKRRTVVTAISVLPAVLLALGVLATAVRAAPAALPSPAPRPTLSQGSGGQCGLRVFDNLKYLVIFRCDDGALAFYRLDNGNGRFQAWLTYEGWALAPAGKVALSSLDDARYQVLFGRASQADVDALALGARTPAKAGYWYHVILKGPTGTTITDDYFFVEL
jgi:hypothetical protein